MALLQALPRILLKAFFFALFPVLLGKTGYVLFVLAMGYVIFRFIYTAVPQWGTPVYVSELRNTLLTLFFSLLILYAFINWPLIWHVLS